MVVDALMEIKINKYGTTKTYCGCPDYQYRQRRIKGSCKHMNYLNQNLQDTLERHKAELKFNPDDFRCTGMKIEDACVKYGDKIIEEWIKHGEIYRIKNRLRLLE